MHDEICLYLYCDCCLNMTRKKMKMMNMNDCFHCCYSTKNCMTESYRYYCCCLSS